MSLFYSEGDTVKREHKKSQRIFPNTPFKLKGETSFTSQMFSKLVRSQMFSKLVRKWLELAIFYIFLRINNLHRSGDNVIQVTYKVTVSVILNDPPFKYGNSRFTRVPLKASLHFYRDTAIENKLFKKSKNIDI